MNRRGREEYIRDQVECFLASDLSVEEWCKRNGICRQTMYRWLSEVAEKEPGLFGGACNIADRNNRRWVELTRKNIAESTALSTAHPPGAVIVDTFQKQAPSRGPHTEKAFGTPSIHILIDGMRITVPPGAAYPDIANVVNAVRRP